MRFRIDLAIVACHRTRGEARVRTRRSGGTLTHLREGAWLRRGKAIPRRGDFGWDRESSCFLKADCPSRSTQRRVRRHVRRPDQACSQYRNLQSLEAGDTGGRCKPASVSFEYEDSPENHYFETIAGHSTRYSGGWRAGHERQPGAIWRKTFRSVAPCFAATAVRPQQPPAVPAGRDGIPVLERLQDSGEPVISSSGGSFSRCCLPVQSSAQQAMVLEPPSSSCRSSCYSSTGRKNRVWWRWRESNSRPQALRPEVYMLIPSLILLRATRRAGKTHSQFSKGLTAATLNTPRQRSREIDLRNPDARARAGRRTLRLVFKQLVRSCLRWQL